jgi:hypothetical protein
MLTSRELRAAAILAHCYELIDILAVRTRAYIASGESEMAARSATHAGFVVGYAQWVEAKVNPNLRPVLAAMSSRRPEAWIDSARIRSSYPSLELQL